MRLSLSDDDGELKELGEEMKAAHLLVKAVKTLQVNKFTNTFMTFLQHNNVLKSCRCYFSK